MTTRTWLSWSSGKDSATALRALRADPQIDLVGLLVTVNEAANRIAMHAVRRSLLHAQAERLGLPVHVVQIPQHCSNEAYEERMTLALNDARASGIEAVAFGDLFLADVRAYRETALAGTGLQPLFPLWGRPTDLLAHDLVAGGLRAVLTCVDPAQLDASFVGRPYDEELLADLPAGVDPCGENGEFHTFVWDCADFASPVEIRTGEVVSRDGFVFCDVIETGGA
ncbi:adenine nucleotide alpha hydrolase [Flexivirga caeni]|uniref:Adenine nucleotide alpha hydrolase n=1 Tax=Flexivirga caeni TaxID=2294115 RepID=A0A3M9MGK9_9MICO|nr:adenine nucleotide alpha hydrolase [Flexivirga caeni]RNI24689.1 adenine nucleotide alpha hydrolase [Flexivirga caeni]